MVGNVFMEDFESTAIHTSSLQPKIWYHYVDDTFVVWEHGQLHLQEFLSHINDLHKNMEVEDNQKISFLDVSVERKDYSVTISVYNSYSQVPPL